tara:strand:- start:556 stop:1383 length:828 start_codon:yes stop_codon:yes gene_type:complete
MMLSFKALDEKKKTAVKINPKLKDMMEKEFKPHIMIDKKTGKKYKANSMADHDKYKKLGYVHEGKGKCDCDCGQDPCKTCGGDHFKKEVSEGKKKDDTYLETDFKKRLKNNEKARKEMMKGPQMKNPHFESKTYDSQEEISEKSTKESTENSILTFGQFHEATRLKKEKGYDKGGTKKPSGNKPKDAALSFVLDKIRKEHGKGAIMTSGGSKQQKKVKGAKSTVGTGKYKKAADAKKQTASDAKKRGFKSTQNYVDTMARYGGKDNYDKGRGLGT